jgi:hypothetical protein
MKEVLIMYRNSYEGGDGWTYYPMKVTINDNCHCGAKRGDPYSYRFCDDGEWFDVQKWDNACGHIDKYKDCYHEHLALKASNKVTVCRKVTHRGKYE